MKLSHEAFTDRGHPVPFSCIFRWRWNNKQFLMNLIFLVAHCLRDIADFWTRYHGEVTNARKEKKEISLAMNIFPGTRCLLINGNQPLTVMNNYTTLLVYITLVGVVPSTLHGSGRDFFFMLRSYGPNRTPDWEFVLHLDRKVTSFKFSVLPQGSITQNAMCGYHFPCPVRLHFI